MCLYGLDVGGRRLMRDVNFCVKVSKTVLAVCLIKIRQERFFYLSRFLASRVDVRCGGEGDFLSLRRYARY